MITKLNYIMLKNHNPNKSKSWKFKISKCQNIEKTSPAKCWKISTKVIKTWPTNLFIGLSANFFKSMIFMIFRILYQTYSMYWLDTFCESMEKICAIKRKCHSFLRYFFRHRTVFPSCQKWQTEDIDDYWLNIVSL